MQVDRRFKIPRIIVSALPDNEREAGAYALKNVLNMSDALETVENAIALFDHALALSDDGDRERTNRHRSWALMGARQGAIYIYAFYQGMQALNGHLWKCASLVPHIDTAKLKDARKTFEASFPNFADVRHGAAHPGEFEATPEKHAANAISELSTDPLTITNSSAFLAGAMIGTAFTCSVGNKAVSYEVTTASAKALEGAFMLLCEALAPVVEHGRNVIDERAANRV